MAKKVRCENGHWYDADKYRECPHCKELHQNIDDVERSENEDSSVIVLSTKNGKKESFWNKVRHKKSKHKASQKMQIETIQKKEKEDKNPDVFDFSLDEMEKGEPIEQTQLEQELKLLNNPFEEKNVDESEEMNMEEAKKIEQELQEAISQRIASSSQVPVESHDAVKPLTIEEAQDKTVAFYEVGQSEPVVGWLVCIKGSYLGQDFQIKAGRNFIGRSVTMDICIMNDPTISRERHAIVTFEPRSNTFSIQAGESNNLVYLNGQAVYERESLKKFDKLEVGQGTYLFIPLCGDEFKWNDYLK